LFHPRPVSQTQGGPCQLIVPNATTITVPRCQIVNVPISFNTVRWGTYAEGNDFCWGTITTYEYLLPNNWSIGTSTSNGVDWIQGSNSVTVTSDPSNGVNGVIRIRPSNSCGSGLDNGQPHALISIDRAAPTFSITGSQAVCSGSSTYTINGVPSGATVSWSLSNSTYASIPNPSTGTTVDVTRTGSYNTTVLLTATVIDCIQTYPAVTKTIALGQPSVLTGSTPLAYWYGNPSTDYNEVCNYQTFYTDMNITGATSVAWSRIAASPSNTSWSQSGNNINFYFWQVGQTAVYRINASNACGSTTNDFGFKSINCSGGGGGGCEQYKIASNPVRGSMKVMVSNIPPPCPLRPAKHDNIVELSIAEIRLFDHLGRLKQVYKEKGAKEATINLTGYKPGIYIIEITDGDYKEVKQIVVQ